MSTLPTTTHTLSHASLMLIARALFGASFGGHAGSFHEVIPQPSKVTMDNQRKRLICLIFVILAPFTHRWANDNRLLLQSAIMHQCFYTQALQAKICQSHMTHTSQLWYLYKCIMMWSAGMLVYQGSGRAPGSTRQDENVAFSFGPRLWATGVDPGWSAATFKQHLRLTPYIFDMICDKLASDLSPGRCARHDALNVPMKVACALWRLANPSSFRDCSTSLHVSLATVHKWTLPVCKLIVKHFHRSMLRAPDSLAEKQALAEGFRCKGALPNVIGAVDGTHFEIERPPDPDVQQDYVNRHFYHSIQVNQ